MWFNAIDSVLTKGVGQRDMKDELDNLEKMINPVQYNPSHYQRIYVSSDSLLYAPNVNWEARPFHFKVIQRLYLIFSILFNQKQNHFKQMLNSSIDENTKKIRRIKD